ncbi:hypothetical protein OG422_17525 [Streptomyces sp. NBC_01525]|uniref:hypothetical protein n=1 Tax=Streptomyces sp. NBC_01525 TaxID=2903893 RepID=UPI003868569B
MPRGRHRHSPPLHRLLPPSSVAGASIVCAAGTWFVGDDLVQRVLAAGAAGAAVTGAVLLRAWDRKAGKRVAELGRARVRDEWRTEERIAELESDAEESREIRAALDTKLRAKRAELARLRTEHADLLRRYATSETERAGALEHRRQLAIEATAPAAALPAPAGAPAPERTEADAAPAAPGGVPRQDAAARPGSGGPAAQQRPAPATFAQADEALRQLARNAARQRGARPENAGGDRPRGARPENPGGDRPRGRHAAPAAGPEATPPAGPPLRPVPAAAAAVAPPAAPRPTASREIGGFDFFGNAAPPALPAPMEEDLADVVGDEAIAEQTVRATARLRPAEPENGAQAGAAEAAPQAAAAEAEADAGAAASEAEAEVPAPASAPDDAQGADPEGTATDGAAPEATASEATAPEGTAPDGTAPEGAAETGAAGQDGPEKDGVGEVIDLTAHDDTEQLDLAGLRTVIS